MIHIGVTIGPLVATFFCSMCCRFNACDSHHGSFFSADLIEFNSVTFILPTLASRTFTFAVWCALEIEEAESIPVSFIALTPKPKIKMSIVIARNRYFVALGTLRFENKRFIKLEL